MTVKVIGAGFGRTGTLSLKFALEMLGFDKCYHMMEVGMNPGHVDQWIEIGRGHMPDWQSLFAGYQATVEWPSCNYWQEQMAAFPEARVILTRRDPEKWYASVMNTIWKVSSGNRNRAATGDPVAAKSSEMAFTVVWDGVFDGRMDDKDHVIACYEAHNQKVIDTVPEDRLLVYQPGEGWEPLCSFLQVDIPDADYPRVNSTEEFTERWKQIAEEARQQNPSR